MKKVLKVAESYIRTLNCPNGKYVVTVTYANDLQNAKLFNDKYLEEIKDALDHHYSGSTKYEIKEVEIVLR